MTRPEDNERDSDLAPTMGGDEFSGPPPRGARDRKQLGPYRIVGELGRGGMGVVYQARHDELKRTVALKVLIAGEDASEEAIVRFQREAEAAARLGHHPHIVPIYDMGREGRLHYFAMHYVEGRALDQLITDETLTPEGSARIVMKVARALHHAHDQGLLHRDVKPANILVSADGEPHITDFGLAKDVKSDSRITRSGVALGTPHYMAPEQADARMQEMDPRSDVYSLGATLYEMLTTQVPFDGETVIHIIKKVIEDEVRPVRALEPTVPRDLETICQACLEKDPARRYASAEALAQDLERFLDGRPIVARPVSWAERWLRRAARHKLATAAAFAALAALVAGAIIAYAGLSGGRRQEEEAEQAVSRAEEGKQRAEAEAGRQKARRQRAEQALAKGKKVARVLLGAHSKLGRIQGELKASFYDSKATWKEHRALFQEQEPYIRTFLSQVEPDPASQATALAVKGWLLWHGDRPEDAKAAFSRARELDESVIWTHLFRAMIFLSHFARNVHVPLAHVSGGRVRFEPGDLGTTRLAGVWQKFTEALSAIGPRGVWGEEAPRDFAAVLDGLRAYKERDFVRAEAGLTRALALWEMAWLEEELLLARSKARYGRQDFAGALEDVRKLEKRLPRWADLKLQRGLYLTGVAMTQRARGTEETVTLEEAVRACEAAVELAPKLAEAWATLGLACFLLARTRERSGRDPQEAYVRAVASTERGIAAGLESARMYCNLALAQQSLALARATRGRSDGDLTETALANYDRALTLDPAFHMARTNRGTLFGNLAYWKVEQGQDAAAHLKRALADFDTVLAAEPGHGDALLNRGMVLATQARMEWAAGKDPRAFLDRAMEDFDGALAGNPDSVQARAGRAMVLRVRAALLDRAEKDAEQAYALACAEAGKALKRRPHHHQALNTLAVACVGMATMRGRKGLDPDPWHEKARKSLETILSLSPGLAQAHKNLAMLLDTLGRYREALPHYEKAMALGLGDDASLKRLARTARYMAGQPPWMGALYHSQKQMRNLPYARTRHAIERAVEAARKDGALKNPRTRYMISAAHCNMAALLSLQLDGRAGPMAEPQSLPPADREALVRQALASLEQAFALGWKDFDALRKDEDLAALARTQGFKDLLDRWEKKKR